MDQSKIKILFITQEYSKTAGGAGVYAYELSKALAESGKAEIHILAPSIKNSSTLIEKGLYLHTCKTISLPFIHIPSFHLQVWMNARKIAKEFNIDTIHSNNNAGLTALKLLPSLAVVHHPVTKEQRFTTFKQQIINLPDVVMDQLTMQLATKLTVGCKFIKEVIVQMNKKLGTKITVIEHGVDMDHFRPIASDALRKKLGINPKTTVIYSPGGARAKRKGLLNLISSFKNGNLAGDFICVVSGSSRETGWTSELQIKLAESGIKDRFIFTGEVSYENLPDLFNMSDFVVFPSLFEGYGLPILESMACKKAVIATNTGGAAQIINNKNGILINVGDETALTHMIKSLLTDISLRNKLASTAFKYVKEKYSWSKVANRVLTQHYKLLNSKNVK